VKHITQSLLDHVRDELRSGATLDNLASGIGVDAAYLARLLGFQCSIRSLPMMTRRLICSKQRNDWTQCYEQQSMKRRKLARWKTGH